MPCSAAAACAARRVARAVPPATWHRKAGGTCGEGAALPGSPLCHHLHDAARHRPPEPGRRPGRVRRGWVRGPRPGRPPRRPRAPAPCAGVGRTGRALPRSLPTRSASSKGPGASPDAAAAGTCTGAAAPAPAPAPAEAYGSTLTPLDGVYADGEPPAVQRHDPQVAGLVASGPKHLAPCPPRAPTRPPTHARPTVQLCPTRPTWAPW